MRRQNPFLSTFGILATIALLLGVGLSVWYSGGLAFNPGKLSAKGHDDLRLGGFASHADFESECSRCHAPLTTTQDQLCMECHRDIEAQITIQYRTHSLIQDVNRCFDCHSEHQGRDFDPTLDAFPKFDHSQTSFDLIWHQVTYETTPMDCIACHDLQGEFKVALSNCAACHAGDDLSFIVGHIQDFGRDCTVCHDGVDRMIDFDHRVTGFPLEGRHAQIKCSDCHGIVQRIGEQRGGSPSFEDPFKDTPNACAGCHQEPGVHLGLFSSECAECHTSSGWRPARLDGSLFDHASQAGFSLDRHRRGFDQQPITCQDCHQGDIHTFEVQTCIDCHSTQGENAGFMQRHQEEFGLDCGQCHDGVDRMREFNHADYFPLDGRHTNIACESCHEGKVFAGTPTACSQCHAEPTIHAGYFGLNCQNCHTAAAWTPAQLMVHDFPLDHGGQGEVECQVCHIERYVQYTCYGCHDHQPEAITASHARVGVSLEALPDCARCHPNGLEGEARP